MLAAYGRRIQRRAACPQRIIPSKTLCKTANRAEMLVLAIWPYAALSWHALLSDLQASPAMVAPGSTPVASWGFATTSNQTSSRVALSYVNGTLAWDSGNLTGPSQRVSLVVPPCDACVLTWGVCVALSDASTGCSPAQRIFTAPTSFNSEAIWAPDNVTGGAGPQFAMLRHALPATPASPLESALLFVTADGPGCDQKNDLGNRKLLGGYKAWVGRSFVGTGPGRSKCDLLGAPQSPLLCPNGAERVYDGHDVSAALGACGDTCALFVEAYGYDQPQFNVSRRVLVELRLRCVTCSSTRCVASLHRVGCRVGCRTRSVN